MSFCALGPFISVLVLTSIVFDIDEPRPLLLRICLLLKRHLPVVVSSVAVRPVRYTMLLLLVSMMI